ncbi:antileukoproteinase-like [Lissotriton helveticus]
MMKTPAATLLLAALLGLCEALPVEEGCSPAERPGLCPVPKTRCQAVQAPTEPPPCTRDCDCPGAEKCCIPLCTRNCTEPIKVTVKPGKCKKIDRVPCFKPDNNTCTDDGGCLGDQKCCYMPCGYRCTDPVTDSPTSV